MNIQEILDELEIPYAQAGESEHVTEGWIGVDCPFCGDIQKYHLGINARTGRCSCWKCGGHYLPKVLSTIASISWKKAKTLLEGWTPTSEEMQPSKGILSLPWGIEPLSTPHKEYLRKRGFEPEELERKWGVMSIGNAPRLSWRIWIPIRYKGETVSWTTRRIDEKQEFRYITAKKSEEKISAKQLLYGSEFAGNVIIVVEGCFDVWKIGNGAVATMGINCTKAQTNKISQYPIRYIAFDSEPRAQESARRLCADLSLLPGITHNLELNSKDAGSATDDEIAEIRKLLK